MTCDPKRPSVMQMPPHRPGYWWENVAPLGAPPDWQERVAPLPDDGRLFGYRESDFMRKQYRDRSRTP